MVGPWHHHFMRNSSQRDSWHVHHLVFETEASCLTVLASRASQKLQGVSVVPGLGPAMQTSSIWLTQGFFENVAQFLDLKDVGCKPRHLAHFERVEGWVCSFIRVACTGQAWPLLVARGPTCFCWPLIPEPASTAVYCHSCTVFYCDSLFLKGEKIKPFHLTSRSWSLSFITSSLSEFRILIQATV